jgi:hypothetical protein
MQESRQFVDARRLGSVRYRAHVIAGVMAVSICGQSSAHRSVNLRDVQQQLALPCVQLGIKFGEGVFMSSLVVNGGTNIPVFGSSLKLEELDALVPFLETRKRPMRRQDQSVPDNREPDSLRFTLNAKLPRVNSKRGIP